MATSLAGSLQRGEVIRRILEWATTTLGADRATLSHITADQVVIEATAGQREALVWVGRTYPLSTLQEQAPVWRAIEERRVVLTGPLDATRVLPEFREAVREVRHLAALPLVIDAEPIGLLVLSRHADRPFGDAELPAMTLLAGVAALALRNALLFHDLQSSARALEAAVDAARDIAAQTDTQSALLLLLRHAVRAAGADEGSMLDLDGAEAVVRVSTGRVPPGSRFPLYSATHDAIASGAPRELAAADYLASHPQTGDAVGGYARFLVVPLVVGGTTLGVVALGRRDDSPFASTEIDGVQQVASLAAMLLRNAFLLDEAKQANEARVEFVDMAVHELRAPLTVILGYLSMLVDGDVDAAAAPALIATMYAKAEEMSESVEEMLSLARLEARSLPLHVDEVDVATLLAGAAARAEGRAALRHGEVTVGHVDDVRVAADVLLAGRILDNLVNNALAYSDLPPKVVLTARSAEGESGAGGAVGIHVADNGRGIAEDLHERVFERFFRADPNGVGTGLGLYLSRGLAEALGGSLAVDSSVPGGGSVFLLTLPRAATTR